jgi:hypothetical protein
LGPLGTAATSRPIVPAPSDCDDGEIGGMIGRGNRSTRRKPDLVLLCPPQIPHASPDANPGRCGGKAASNSLSYGTAFSFLVSRDKTSKRILVSHFIIPRRKYIFNTTVEFRL